MARVFTESVTIRATPATLARWRSMADLFAAVAAAGSRRSMRYAARNHSLSGRSLAFADAVQREHRLLVKEARRLGLDVEAIGAQPSGRRGPAARPMADPTRKRGESGEQSGLDDPRQ